MKTVDCLQTMALTFQEICQGERPWVALGNFMNDWFDYAKDRRSQLVTAPLSLPESLSDDTFRWAVFSTASVEWLCECYSVPCPSWVHAPTYCLSEPWFDAPYPDKPQVREWLVKHTPEPFTRRNIYCGNRIFANKYEFAEQHRRLLTTLS
ncbi:MAG: hypothetical protein ACYDER_06915 [Ktedonobacteraceae bacterium]